MKKAYQLLLNKMVDPSAPMPWIGLYAAAASLAWVLALIADTIRSICHRKLWFPGKYSSLNAASLTVIAVAVKLAMDLTTNMPGRIDQFAKLSSTALLGASTIHFMPSLGSMSGRDILVNLTALGILIGTLSVNVIIQVVTGVIDSYMKILQIVFVSLNVYSFIVLISSALTVFASKSYLESKYKELHGAMLEEELQGSEIFNINKLNSCLNKYWMMAKTGSPQFVMARSEACYILGLISSSFLIILVVQLKLYHIPWKHHSSDYKWSVRHIFSIQIIAVCLCVLTSLIRFIHALLLNVWRVKKFLASIMSLGMKNYEVKKLVEWKKRPPPLNVRGSKMRKFIHTMKVLLINICIGAQLVIVMTNKLLGLISIVLVLLAIVWFVIRPEGYMLIVVSILFVILCFKKPRKIVERFFVTLKKIILKEPEASVSSNESRMQTAILMTCKLLGIISIFGTLGFIILWGCVGGGFSILLVPFFILFFKRPRKMTLRFLKKLKKIILRESEASANPSESQHMPAGSFQDLRNYVLLLEGETIQDKYLEFINTSMNSFMKMGAKHRPRYLMELLENSTEDFSGVLDFESDQFSTTSLEPPSCWALPIIVLAIIAIALPNFPEKDKNRLLRGVTEGFKYVHLVEKSRDFQKKLVRSREAAEFAWVALELRRKWLHLDLYKLANESQSSRNTLQTLANQSEKLLNEFKNDVKRPDIVVANTMYKISNTLLLQHWESDRLFHKICVMVADIFVACFTNLPHAILGRCYCNALEDCEEHVEEAACLYGETRDILKDLSKHKIPSLSPDQLVYIEEWRALLKHTSHTV